MPKNTFFNLNEEKQESVMRAAIDEFLKYGFEKGNIGNIAKNAGIAKGSIYQYFKNKKELFLYSVNWSVDLLLKKYNRYIMPKDTNIFDYFYESSKEILIQFREEKDIVIFIQDVFLGKYSSMTDESITAMMDIMDDYVLKLIQEGKNNGSIRKDIDDSILSLFLTGASMKIKESMLKKARNKGTDIIYEDFETYENDIKAMMELLKNGMGVK
ncbi:TetR/AcrR family transcriptional regulator [Clostridium sp. WILCCON 0269]|uniref:TetR/AcrR family transcriptional regulator n=1 Tax=Candidatus Clostridium eludens TaxID=3381663 RepID=A0ABW8SDU9_9CLOT